MSSPAARCCRLPGEPGRSKGVRRVRASGGGASTAGKPAASAVSDWYVVFCESKQDAETVVEVLTDWLRQRGLALSSDKTRIVHLTEGFDFLGFTIRQYKAPRTTRTGYK